MVRPSGAKPAGVSEAAAQPLPDPDPLRDLLRRLWEREELQPVGERSVVGIVTAANPIASVQFSSAAAAGDCAAGAGAAAVLAGHSPDAACNAAASAADRGDAHSDGATLACSGARQAWNSAWHAMNGARQNAGAAVLAGCCSETVRAADAEVDDCSGLDGENAALSGARGDAAQPRPTRDPIRDLLRSLRGRQVTLQVGERLVTGKLITTDPIIIVGPVGEATMVAPGVLKSVQF